MPCVLQEHAQNPGDSANVGGAEDGGASSLDEEAMLAMLASDDEFDDALEEELE